MRVFNGTNHDITADGANVASMNRPFSVAAWLKCAGTITNAVYYGEGSVSSARPMLQMQCNSGKFRIFMRRDSNGLTSDVNGIASTLTVADGTLHHVVYTQDGSGNWQAYVDGIADATAKGSYTPAVMTVGLVTFGAVRRNAPAENFWAGTLGEIATWSRQLSAAEAMALAAGLPASHLAPDHYWPLWGTDSPEPDIGTATKVAGTLTGTSAAGGGKTGLGLLEVAV